MSKGRKNRNAVSRPAEKSAVQTPAHAQPIVAKEPSRLLFWAASPWAIVAILAAGAALRFWGITERCFVDPDTAGHYMGGEVYRETWRWFASGAHKTIALPDYLDREMGCMAAAKFDNGKPLNHIFRAIVIGITGERSLVAHFTLDIFFALVAMGLLLCWCRRQLGPRIALLAACLWMVNGFHFQCTGRGYDYSAMMLFGTLAWLSFMRRTEGRIYCHTFLAGLSLGAGITYHYSFFNYLPLVGVFVLLFRNPSGIKGKLIELGAFIGGFAVFPVAILAWYQILTWATGTAWRWEILSPLFEQGNTFGDMHVSIRFFGNAWFMWQLLNGWAFMLFLFAGVVAIAAQHVHRYGWRWSICDDQLFILNGVVSYGVLIWGIYSCIYPRVQMPEVAVWPVVAAVGLHNLTLLATKRVSGDRAINVVQALVLAFAILEGWHLTTPLIKMGGGMLKAMNTMSAENKTAIGEGQYVGMWPCTDRPRKPIEPTPPLTRWDCLDDFLTANRYDYFYVHYGRVLTHMVMYPGAGHPLMLGTYNRLVSRTQPVWRFEFGAPIHARIEAMNMGWTRQTRSIDEWRKTNPNQTPYDLLIEREAYFDVYRAADVVSAFRESRIELLAQLVALCKSDPNRFQQIAPRFQGFIQYNATNSFIMAEAQRSAESMTGGGRR